MSGKYMIVELGDERCPYVYFCGFGNVKRRWFGSDSIMLPLFSSDKADAKKYSYVKAREVFDRILDTPYSKVSPRAIVHEEWFDAVGDLDKCTELNRKVLGEAWGK